MYVVLQTIFVQHSAAFACPTECFHKDQWHKILRPEIGKKV